jgi:hypothetical protein
MKPDNIIEFKPQPPIIDLLSIREERLLQNAQDKNSLLFSQTDIFSPPPHSPMCREFSMQEPQEFNNHVKQPEITETDQNELQMHLNDFVDAYQYEIKDTPKDQIDNLCENKPAINRLQTSNSNFDDVPGEYKLQVLRETLSAREQVKPDISFKEKLGQIFKNRE